MHMSMKTCNLICLQTPLHSASIKGDVQCAEMLMEHVRSPICNYIHRVVIKTTTVRVESVQLTVRSVVSMRVL